MLKIGVVYLEDDGEHVGRPHQVGVVRGLLDVSGREGVGALVDVLDEVTVELLQRLESVLFNFFSLPLNRYRHKRVIRESYLKGKAQYNGPLAIELLALAC